MVTRKEEVSSSFMSLVVLVQNEMALFHQIVLGHLIKEGTFHLFKMGKGMLHIVF